MPLEDECADLVVNMFAPVAIDEFRRTLRTGGHLIIGVAGVHHLEGLKRAIYDEVYLNEKFNDTYEGFVPVSVKSVKYSTTVNSSEAIWALFQMTPYFHRTSIADKEKLLGLSSYIPVSFVFVLHQLGEDMAVHTFYLVQQTFVFLIEQHRKQKTLCASDIVLFLLVVVDLF